MANKITVPGEGPLNAKICFVGEAPGREEIRLGRPFIGPAGRILDRLLLQAEIVRRDCRILNVVPERPPNNDISKFIKFSGKSVKTTPEYDEYERLLYREIDECKANVIVPLGNVPLYALTRKMGITKWRGSILEGVTGRKTIPTFHPSALQHIGGRKKDKGVNIYAHYHTSLILDLKRIMKDSDFPSLNLPVRTLRIAPSFEEAVDYLHSCLDKDMIGFDIETSSRSKEISCISFAISPTDIMSIPFTHNDNEDYFSVDREAMIWRAIAEVLEDKNVVKVGQNLTFDISFIHRKMGIVTRNIHDTMIAQALIAPDLPKGLDFITSVYTRESYYKGEGKIRMKSDKTSDERFWEYNCKDSAICMEVIDGQLAQLRRQGNISAYNSHIRSAYPYSYMHVRGVRVDTDLLSTASKDAEDKIITLTKELQDICGFAINPNSNKQVMEYFYITKGLLPYKDRKTGKPTVGEDALKRIARKGHKEAELLLSIRSLAKLKGTYLDVALDEDGRLRSSYNTVGTTSGRPSSSKTIVYNTGMDMENLVPEVKKAIISDPGCVYYDIDLGQAENRVVAYIAPEYNMISAFEEGRDIHAQTASLIFRKHWSEISDEPGSCSLAGGKYSERFFGKKSNHALNYDLGYKAFSLMMNIPENEGKFIVERYHGVYPGIRDWHKHIRDSLSKKRSLTTPLGGSRTFLGRWGDDLFKEAYSYTPQSVVAQVMKERGLLYLYEGDEFHPVEVLNDVYDSITIQISIKEGWEYHSYVLTSLVESLQTPIPGVVKEFIIPADVSMGLNLKDMEDVDLNPSDLEKSYSALLNA